MSQEFRRHLCQDNIDFYNGDYELRLSYFVLHLEIFEQYATMRRKFFSVLPADSVEYCNAPGVTWSFSADLGVRCNASGLHQNHHKKQHKSCFKNSFVCVVLQIFRWGPQKIFKSICEWNYDNFVKTEKTWIWSFLSIDVVGTSGSMSHQFRVTICDDWELFHFLDCPNNCYFSQTWKIILIVLKE